MMLFSILDLKSKTFGQLAEARTCDEAIRSFQIAIQKAPEGSLLHDFPEDFQLFKIGSWDPDLGDLLPESAPLALITGFEVKNMLLNNTCSEVAVRESTQESNVVALKSAEEEVNG